ncbi:MAG: hypothetical protein ACYTG0_08250 [Planctomycetota bacterium]|jgi:hypothetical protein
MEYQQPTSETATVKLLPFEGLKLLELLEELADLDSPRLAAGILGAVNEKLGDAIAVARWLREHVLLELHPEEARDVLEALNTTLGQMHEKSQDAHTTLSAVRLKLLGVFPHSTGNKEPRPLVSAKDQLQLDETRAGIPKTVSSQTEPCLP